MTPMTGVQKLYEVCKASFSAMEGLPSAEVVASVRAVLDDIKCSDLGLEDQSERARLNGRIVSRLHDRSVTHPAITYLHLFECKRFSMGIFCLPQTAVIPLHNHPGMTVFSKLLYGSMHVKSYDWVDPEDDRDPSIPRLAKVVKDHILVAPCETFTLYPASGGNIHSFTAVTSCAVLDVLAPPYNTTAGRPCIYYQVSDISTSNGAGNESNVYLEEFQPPSDFVVDRGNYKGPKVVPSTS